ncbi:MAG: DUF1028 domain-containing protein [Thermomicrobiales bacterium]|nr:DUF1028 domain-containing protein [Thermomicrobiales bacterium]MCO5220468.1 DUF1028 domain-containing protein [Thermomicrobiales bacterium]
MTFSIAGHCPRTGRFGVAVSSSSPAVAARCAFVRTGAGAACSQNITDPRLGDRLLDLVGNGYTADEAMAQVVNDTELIAYRQLSVVDGHGGSVAFSGERVLGVSNIARVPFAAVAGNLLANAEIPLHMVERFAERPDADLEDRLLAALNAALALGGEQGPVHSAGLKVVGRVTWPETDLRVDWSSDPVHDLAKLWRLWRPLKDDYVIRALDPASAPSYGVPGDSDQ